MTTPEDTELKLLLIDHFTNSMPVQVDRDYAEHLLDRVTTISSQEAEELAIYNYRSNILADNFCSDLGTYDFDGIAKMILNEENK